MSDQDPQRPSGSSPPEGGAGEDAKAGDQPSPEEKAAAAKAKAEAAAKAKAAREAAEAAKPPWERDPATPEWTEADEDPLAVALRARHGEAIEAARSFAGDLVFKVNRSSVAEVCGSLNSDLGYRLLVDILGAHYPQREGMDYEVVYIAYNFEDNRRVRVRVETDEQTAVPSVCGVWRGANWMEREVYDMFGVRFADHPDMTRILLWEGFNGHPLRKDFPVEGVDTGAAIYPEYYEEQAGPVTGTGTGWRPAEPAGDEGGGES